MLFQGKKCGPNLSEAGCPEKNDCLTGNILSNYPNKKRFHKVVVPMSFAYGDADGFIRLPSR